MRKRGSVCDYIVARNEDLRQNFLNRLGRRAYRRIDDIFADIAQAPARRFYISEPRVLQLLHYRRRCGDLPPDIQRNRRLMVEEIMRRVEARMASEPELSLIDAVYEVVNMPAPSFYLTPRSIRTLLYDHLASRPSEVSS